MASSKIEEPRVITIRLPKFKIPSSDKMSLLSIPLSIIAAGLIISISLISAGNTIRDTIKNTNFASVQQGTTANNGTTQPTISVSMDQVKEVFSSGRNITFGDANRKVLFVEFSDPSCPYCHIAGGENRELNKQAGSNFTLAEDGGSYIAPVKEMRKLVDEGKASFAWIYTNGHGNGRLANQAMYCAYDQGKFWGVHDLLMTNTGYSFINDNVKNDVAKASEMANFLASAIDKDYMLSCLQSEKYKEKLNQDEQFASTWGVQGTPGFFVNNANFGGAVSYDDMKSTVENYLK